MKFVFRCCLFILLLFACTSAWAGSDYYAKLTVTRAGTGDGKALTFTYGEDGRATGSINAKFIKAKIGFKLPPTE